MELEQLDKAARLLGTSATPDALLQTLLTYAREDAGADHALLYTLDDDGHALVPSLIVGRPADDPVKLERFVIGEGASGRATRAKAPIVLGDLAECLFNRQRELMERLGARAAFATPVLGSDGHIIGAIEHHFARPHRPRDIDLYHATVYARLMAAVIERVGFRDQDDVREALALPRRSETGAVASELLASSLDWSKTLDNVARVALPALADLCVVSIADGARPLARNVAAHVDANEHAEL